MANKVDRYTIQVLHIDGARDETWHGIIAWEIKTDEQGRIVSAGLISPHVAWADDPGPVEREGVPQD